MKEAIVITGKSGSGKTTLGRMIAGNQLNTYEIKDSVPLYPDYNLTGDDTAVFDVGFSDVDWFIEKLSDEGYSVKRVAVEG